MAQLTTFVFTDLVGSVALKRRMPGADADARDAAYVERVLRPHRERIEAGLADSEGRVVSTAGDGHFLVFPNTARAARWAIALVLAHESDTGWTTRPEVRIGMHAGEPQPDPSDPDNFVGRAVDYAARLADHAQGSQVLVSRTAASLIEDGALEGVSFHGHGTHNLKGIGEVELYELIHGDRRPTTPRRSPGELPPRDWSLLPRTMALTQYVAESESGKGSSGVATRSRPRRVGNYELGELLGAGGMGNVYKARHAQFERPRAVKIIRPDLIDAGGESVVQRFYQEVRATGSLEHPNLVVAIDSSSPQDEEHYLVMEHIDGVSLDVLLQREGAMPADEACEIARQAALGLGHLHERGLVHRDVKPSNLMLTLADSPHLPIGSGTAGGQSAATKLPVVKLMDLGLALLAPREGEDRLTQINRGGMGTGHYMPPEQWRTTSVDIRADIYSLGCTLYHLLTGEPPFARSDLKPERAHSVEPPPTLETLTGAPRGLAELVERMLAKDPADRPQTPLEVAEALQRFASGNRLSERIRRVRSGETARDPGHLETRFEPANPRETNAIGDRRPSPADSSTLPQKTSWLITAVATAVACGAIITLLGVRTAMLDRHRADLVRTANFAAGAVATAIQERLERLDELAETESLKGWLAEIEQAGGYNDTLPAIENLQKWIDKQKIRFDDKFTSNSWFITDASGVQLARSPAKRSIGQQYNRRDYFHGLGPEANPSDPEPLQTPHQSDVYRSSTSRVLKVAFSVPIYNDDQAVVGILAMSVKLGDFRELEDSDRRADEIEILLADTGVDLVDKERGAQRGLVLHHRGLRDAARLSPAMLKNIASVGSLNEPAMLDPYRDPVGRSDEEYWGAVARVAPDNLPDARTGTWVVIAQEPKP